MRRQFANCYLSIFCILQHYLVFYREICFVRHSKVAIVLCMQNSLSPSSNCTFKGLEMSLGNIYLLSLANLRKQRWREKVSNFYDYLLSIRLPSSRLLYFQRLIPYFAKKVYSCEKTFFLFFSRHLFSVVVSWNL